MPRVYVKKDPEKVASGWFSMRVTPEMDRRLRELSEATNKTKARIAREILEKALIA